jgi:Tfp pilus assembly protein PilV
VAIVLRCRAGFGLAECLIAALLLAGALLTFAAAGVAARGRILATRADTSATQLAGMLLDSLRAADAAADGATRRNGIEAAWRVCGGRIELVVSYRAGTVGVRNRRYEVLATGLMSRQDE